MEQTNIDLKEAVLYEVNRLEPDFKLVLTLRMMEGYSTEETATILNIGLQIAANLAILSEPFLPFTAQKLKEGLNLSNKSWQETGGFLLKEGGAIHNLPLLFEKIEEEVIQTQIQKLQNSKRMNELAGKEVAQIKEVIQYDDFAKMDIRIGTIIEAEKVAKSKKLLKLTVNDGLNNRTILSGIAEYFNPEEVINQQVSFLANLAPRPMMGMISEGMILMAEDKDGSLAFIQPGKLVWNGAGVS